MLILTRYAGQKIIVQVGEGKQQVEVEFCVLAVGDKKIGIPARIGVNAPQNVRIMREEIMNRDEDK